MEETKKKVENTAKSEIQAGKLKAIDAAVQQIEKQFGKGSIMRLGSEERVEIEVIPTGALSLDLALGIGGVPKGRIIEIYGPESSGKTTLAIHILAEAQKMGQSVAFIDAEHALDPIYAKNIGLNRKVLADLALNNPDAFKAVIDAVK